MKKCELCKSAARTYCESDQANLCWSCDAKVHGANFLVARHARAVLCQSCQFPTPWKASGAQLGHTVSVCERCMISNENNNREIQEQEENGSSDDIEEDSDSESDSDSNDDGGGEEDGGAGDNQVVPWSPTAPAASSSCSCTSNDDNDVDCVESVNVLSFKKQRLQDDLDRSCSLRMYGNTATSVEFYSSSAGGSLKEKRKELDPTV
uniref:B box-type domain-containing protein n=1 Tax=Salix viminalis TaxID=40686 RepID=A0A6N2MAN6_SALVM